MKNRWRELLTKQKLFRLLKITVIAVVTILVFLSILGTVAYATGLVDDTVNVENLYIQILYLIFDYLHKHYTFERFEV